MELAKLKAKYAAVNTKLASYKCFNGDYIAPDNWTMIQNVISNNPTKAKEIKRLDTMSTRLFWKIMKIEAPEYYNQSLELAKKYHQKSVVKNMV